MPDGAGWRASDVPALITSTHESFRPVDAKFGPDGALYVTDWYNPIIGHYQSSFRHPDRDKEHGRIWRVTHDGMERDRTQPRMLRQQRPRANVPNQNFSPQEIADWSVRGQRLGCIEALMCLGDKPELAYRGYRSWLRDIADGFAGRRSPCRSRPSSCWSASAWSRFW